MIIQSTTTTTTAAVKNERISFKAQNIDCLRKNKRQASEIIESLLQWPMVFLNIFFFNFQSFLSPWLSFSCSLFTHSHAPAHLTCQCSKFFTQPGLQSDLFFVIIIIVQLFSKIGSSIIHKRTQKRRRIRYDTILFGEPIHSSEFYTFEKL